MKAIRVFMICVLVVLFYGAPLALYAHKPTETIGFVWYCLYSTAITYVVAYKFDKWFKSKLK